MEIFLDAVLDTLKLFPFLLIIYILIELLENKTSFTKNHTLLQGGLAPLIGSATGIIPQCGFSVMASKLYEKKYIRTGTLIAVFLATSDEALIIMLSSGEKGAFAVMPLVAVKLIIALVAGYSINAVLKNERLVKVQPSATSGSQSGHCDHDSHGENGSQGSHCDHDNHSESVEHSDHGSHNDHTDCTEHSHEDIHAYSCGREHEGKKAVTVYFVEPLLHSLKITLYLFIVNLVFGYVLHAVGEEKVASFMQESLWLQPLGTALVGLIPNCASSVLITGVYLNNSIAFGSLVAGLCTNAGLGFVVLLKDTKKAKRNALLIITIYVISIIAGYAINGIMLLCNLL